MCIDCEKNHLIFDLSKHGWDGFVCGNYLSVPDDELKLWQCPKCANNNHKLGVLIRSNGKRDFIEESGIADGEVTFSEDEWTEAFGYIVIQLKCCSCEHSDDSWAYETM